MAILDNIVWVDLETGGLSPKLHQLTQIAAVPTTGGIELEALGQPFERKITLISGRYTKEALEVQNYDPVVWDAEAIPINRALEEFKEWLKTWGHPMTSAKGSKYSAAHMGGHNVAFDGEFLRASAERNKLWLPITNWTGGMFDTLHLARWVSLLEGKEPPDYKLETLCKFYGLPAFDAHDAMNDVRATIRLARALLMGF